MKRVVWQPMLFLFPYWINPIRNLFAWLLSMLRYEEAGSNVVNTLATEIILTGKQMPFRVYPNPFRDEIMVEMEIATPQSIKIEIYTMLGVKIYDYKQEIVAAGNFRHSICDRDIPDISAINILRLESGDQTFFLKIIKNQ